MSNIFNKIFPAQCPIRVPIFVREIQRNRKPKSANIKSKEPKKVQSQAIDPLTLPALEDKYPSLTGTHQLQAICRYQSRKPTEHDLENEDLHAIIKTYSIVPPPPDNYEQLLEDLRPYSRLFEEGLEAVSRWLEPISDQVEFQ